MEKPERITIKELLQGLEIIRAESKDFVHAYKNLDTKIRDRVIMADWAMTKGAFHNPKKLEALESISKKGIDKLEKDIKKIEEVIEIFSWQGDLWDALLSHDVKIDYV